MNVPQITIDAYGRITAIANKQYTAKNTTYSNFVKSGSGAKAGLVPAPSTTAGTTKYLREDGIWTTPPNSNSAHSHSAGLGLTGSGSAGTSGTYTYKVNLVNEAVASNAASYTAGGTSKFYAVQLDKNNKLGVYVPWSNTTYGSMSINEGTTGTATTSRVLTAANLKGIINAHAPTKTGGGASGTWSINVTGRARFLETKHQDGSAWYGDNYPLYAQWETSNICKIKCDNYYTKVDYANSATKATQDGAGNVITSKYVTLDTVQTISGTKTMTGSLNAHGGISLNSSTAQAAGAPEYILGIKAFAEGGNVIWQSKANVSVGYADNAGTATKLATDAGGTTTPVYFSGGVPKACTMINSGAWYGGLTYVGGDGVMEVGKYIDFHVNKTGTSDYDVRISAATTGLTISGTTSGTFKGNLNGNASTANTAATAGQLTNINENDKASSSNTWRRLWFSYDNNTTGRPAYDDRFAIQTSTGTLKAPIFSGNLNGNAKTATKATQDGAGNVITSKYVTLDTAQTISGTKTMTGSLKVSGRYAGGGDDEGIIVGFANNGYAGLCLGGPSQARSVFYFKSDGTNPFWRYNNGSASYDISHPSKSGTIALTSDLANYLPLSKVSNYALPKNPGSIEMYPGTSAGHGGFIDFHYNNSSADYTSRIIESASGTLVVNGANITKGKVYGAVWNDYAEYRICNKNFIPGQVVYEIGDDTMSITTKRLQRGCSIISDTFGFAIGETDSAKCPIAVSGRVLAYPYESREEFAKHIGWPVCSGPNGTVSIMTEEEEEKYPSRIIGTISAVPDYEEWGTDKVKINNRIWIQIK